MAFIVDHGQQSNNNYKHFCKICKKGFMCGRALGGHMRAHGIGDDLNHMDDDDDLPSDWDEPNNNNNENKRMYALRANPNRLKNYSNCEHCGKEFSSWKSYFEHGRCTASDDAESLVSSPGSDDEAEYDEAEYNEDDVVQARKPGWSKRKRSTRAKIDGGHDHTNNNNNVINNNNNNNLLYRPSSEEEDLANCLMMLSSATIDRSTAVLDQPEESCASASKDEEFIHRQNNNNNLVNFVTSAPPNNNNNNVNISYHRVLDKAKGVATTSHNNNKNGMFECKACKKVFNSHQALGGHRASHKKVKGCFASRLDNNEDNNNLVRGDHDHDVTAHEDQFFHSKTLSSLTFDHGTNPMSSKRKSKVHECSICHRIFSSGQALGGHKRCHWITSNSADPSSLAKQFQQFHRQIEQIQQNNVVNESSDQPLNLNLNLNLPAPNANANRFQVPADIYLQSWLRAANEEGKNDMMMNKNINVVSNNNNNNVNSNGYVDDEADSKVKLAKLSDLKDMNVNGSSSPWLQVGIGSTSERVGSDP